MTNRTKLVVAAGATVLIAAGSYLLNHTDLVSGEKPLSREEMKARSAAYAARRKAAQQSKDEAASHEKATPKSN